MILGIDEVGRGPWAGPLVVGAVVLGGVNIEGLTDSKKLSKSRREQLYESIIEQAAAYASGWVSAIELDEIGLSQALRLATRRAVEQIKVSYSEIIIDGKVNLLAGTGKGGYVVTMPKADLLVPSVSAASIVAKVERDRYMAKLDEIYAGYGFKSHAGYGVARHRQAINKLGVTPEHRLSFAPLAQYRQAEEVKPNVDPEQLLDAEARRRPVTTRAIGDSGEDAAAAELLRRGHTIIDRNWRTKLCEIDIISEKDDTIYFSEVKYRKNDQAGDGLAYITPKKLNQLKLAARLYVHFNQLNNKNLRLVAIAATGSPAEVKQFIELD